MPANMNIIQHGLTYYNIGSMQPGTNYETIQYQNQPQQQKKQFGQLRFTQYNNQHLGGANQGREYKSHNADFYIMLAVLVRWGHGLQALGSLSRYMLLRYRAGIRVSSCVTSSSNSPTSLSMTMQFQSQQANRSTCSSSSFPVPSPSRIKPFTYRGWPGLVT